MYKHNGVIDDLVGETPVVLLQRVVPPGAGTVRLKLETRSPNATVMDRVAKRMARDAGPGSWRVAGDGALAIAVAMQGALHGRQVEAFLPEGTCLEVRQTLLVYRAKVTLTPFAQGADGSLEAARAAGEVLSDRFPEERIDAFVAPVEVLSCVVPVLREKFPAVKGVGWKPFEGAWRPHRQAGVSFGPEPTQIVDDPSAWKMRDRLGRDEGLLLSIGAAAGVELACRIAVELGADARVYALAFDTGERDFSLAEQL